jgi:transketolase
MGINTAFDQTAISALRFLSVDQVEAANSGHPGLPLGAAPMAYALFRRRLKFSPSHPNWVNRDRFVLSAGHGSALLYSLLHLFGYDLSLEDLKSFRRLGGLTPGHPEFGLTPGVEATTGPLGQGLAMAAGMALTETWLRATCGSIIDYHTYALVSDGDLMEGIGAEAASLAGHLGLGRLICLYDDNSISLDGETSLSFTEDVTKRFEAYNWQVLTVEDGENVDAIDAAIIQALADESRPTLIRVKTVIGFGSPKAGTASVHGSPLGAEGTKKTKEALGWPVEPTFYVPEEAASLANEHRHRGEVLHDEWERRFEAFEDQEPELTSIITAMASGALRDGWDTALKSLEFPDKAIATRDSGKTALNAVAAGVPWLMGGSADLASSTKTVIDGAGVYSKENPGGRNIWFGVREHAMGAMVNGMALSGLRAFGSTFLVFSDYMRGAIRLSALMGVPSIWVFTHDSVFVGEDGPTHQPIEHVMSLRLIPDLKVYRPCDANETAAVYHTVMERGEPAVIILTRQALPTLNDRRDVIWEGTAKGGYIIHEPEDDPAGCLIATGSEVSLAFEAASLLQEQGLPIRVVSIPCMELFLDQDPTEIAMVLGEGLPVVSLEAGRTLGWDIFLGDRGFPMGIDQFGHSGEGKLVYEELDMTPEKVCDYMAAAISTLGDDFDDDDLDDDDDQEEGELEGEEGGESQESRN